MGKWHSLSTSIYDTIFIEESVPGKNEVICNIPLYMVGKTNELV